MTCTELVHFTSALAGGLPHLEWHRQTLRPLNYCHDHYDNNAYYHSTSYSSYYHH